jgi:hypothetical protein
MRTKFFFIFSVLALALVLVACGPVAPAAVDRSISVSGSGTISLAPDVAYIYIGVTTDNADIALAVSSNNSQSQALVDALKAAGVAAEDIQTSNFSVYSNANVFDQETGQYIGTTYSVNNTVYVTVRDLSRLGSLLNAAVGSGANTINSITFDVADKSAAQVQARQQAMENAASLAGELAASAGASLGEVRTISYTEYSYSPYFGMGGGGASAPNASVPIQPGLIQVSVSVNVTFGMK